MSTTPNYGWPLIATNQASPEITHNQAMIEIDDALGGMLITAMTDADYTLNVAAVPSEAGHLIYKFTGAITADRNIIVPENKKLYAVWNNTTSPYNLVIKMSTGSGVTVAYSSTSSYTLVYCDGTNVVLVGLEGPTGPTGPAGSYADPAVNNQAGNYLAVLSDDGNIIVMEDASACTVTVDYGEFPIGAVLTIIQLGTGQVTLVNGSSSIQTFYTPSSYTSRTQYSTISLTQIAGSIWLAAGDLT